MSGLSKHILTWRLGIALVLWLVSGCQPAVTPVPAPSPHAVVVQITPALMALQPIMKECTTGQGVTGLVLSETSAQALHLDQTRFGLRWGLFSQPDGYAAELGQEELVMILSPQNPLNEISLADLQAAYSGALRSWPSASVPGEIMPWVYPPGDDAQIIFDQVLFNGLTPSQQAVYIAPTPQAMIETIAQNPNAIGFIPRRWLDESVKEITVLGIDPVRLRNPILVLSQVEPYGWEKDWLLCLQERLVVPSQ